MSRGRRAVTEGSFWRTAPAAAFRGFANVGVPASSRLRLSRANSSRGMNTSPRTSMTGAAASAPVAPRRAPDEAAVLVEQRDPQAVDLRLAHVRERGARQRAADPGLELAQVVRRGRVVEREHGVVVLDRLEDIGRRPADALGGAVRGDEVGKARLELPELAHESVVLGVRDLGPCLDVVQIVVVVDLLAQLGDALRGVGPRHVPKHNTAGSGCWGCLAARVRVTLYCRATGRELARETQTCHDPRS